MEAKAITDKKVNQVYMSPANVKMTKDPHTYRRDLVFDWIHARKGMEVNEIQELENLFNFLKGTMDDKMYQKYLKGQFKLTPADHAHIKLMKDLLIELNKLKYGEKRTNLHVGVTYETVQEMIMKDGPDTPDN